MEYPDMIVCRCEEVSYHQLYRTITEHDCTSREVKLRTRAGMGFCGGRVCRHLIESMVCDITGQKIQDQIPLKYQPPVRPIPFGPFGGEI